MATISEYTHPPFPIFLDLKGAEVLVAGNNDIAARRAEAVLRAGAKVDAESNEVCSIFNVRLQPEPKRRRLR